MNFCPIRAHRNQFKSLKILAPTQTPEGFMYTRRTDTIANVHNSSEFLQRLKKRLGYISRGVKGEVRQRGASAEDAYEGDQGNGQDHGCI